MQQVVDPFMSSQSCLVDDSVGGSLKGKFERAIVCSSNFFLHKREKLVPKVYG